MCFFGVSASEASESSAPGFSGRQAHTWRLSTAAHYRLEITVGLTFLGYIIKAVSNNRFKAPDQVALTLRHHRT